MNQDNLLREETEEEYLAIKPLVEIIKARYPEGANIEGFEPALTSDIAQIAVSYADKRLEAERERVLALAPVMELKTTIDSMDVWFSFAIGEDKVETVRITPGFHNTAEILMLTIAEANKAWGEMARIATSPTSSSNAALTAIEV